MTAEITVGPPVLTIHQGSTFMVTDLDGEIEADTAQGMFADDMRLVSYYAISANGYPWARRTSGAITYYAARIYLMNGSFPTEEGVIPEGTLELVITRAVGDGIHEDLDVTNYGQERAHFNLEVALRSDFADLFEVKSGHFVRRGRILTEWREHSAELVTSYKNHDFQRCLVYRVDNSASPAHYANGRITFEIDLAPGATWHTCGHYILVQHGRPPELAHDRLEKSVPTELDQLHQEWLNSATRVTSSNEEIYRFYRQSVEDMGALRLHEHDLAHDVWVPAAGVPWFVTLFGRDSLIASLQSMMVSCGLSQGALAMLAKFQGTKRDDYRDEQPGKIMHEIRHGELAHFHQIPHTPYYGTWDATPLYLITLHEAWKWQGDTALLQTYREAAEKCLEWIDQYGDLDGDGFQEYQTFSPKGYENMGWKDAGDAVVYADGSQVKQPKGTCELQGYVFDAWMRMAEVFDALNEKERAAALRRKAAELQARFEERFWCEEIGSYAFALDPEKKPVCTVASNAGHCLWSGIARSHHAARVVQRLMQPDMWTGWGIRTLSSRNPAYNPHSYHRGSIWPHDNSIIAMGFKRYGFAAEAAQIARDISRAAADFQSHRIPELYAGIAYQPDTFPVQYLGANVPQAWAAGSVFQCLQAILGIQADAPHGRLYLDPQLPHWLPDITLHGLKIGHSKLDLRFWREDESTRWDILGQEGEVQIQLKAWTPWRIE